MSCRGAGPDSQRGILNLKAPFGDRLFTGRQETILSFIGVGSGLEKTLCPHEEFVIGEAFGVVNESGPVTQPELTVRALQPLDSLSHLDPVLRDHELAVSVINQAFGLESDVFIGDNHTPFGNGGVC